MTCPQMPPPELLHVGTPYFRFFTPACLAQELTGHGPEATGQVPTELSLISHEEDQQHHNFGLWLPTPSAAEVRPTNSRRPISISYSPGTMASQISTTVTIDRSYFDTILRRYSTVEPQPPRLLSKYYTLLQQRNCQLTSIRV
jgi:hypothetical protein